MYLCATRLFEWWHRRSHSRARTHFPVCTAALFFSLSLFSRWCCRVLLLYKTLNWYYTLVFFFILCISCTVFAHHFLTFCRNSCAVCCYVMIHIFFDCRRCQRSHICCRRWLAIEMQLTLMKRIFILVDIELAVPSCLQHIFPYEPFWSGKRICATYFCGGAQSRFTVMSMN